MVNIWLISLICAVVLLGIILIAYRIHFKVIGYVMTNIGLAAVMLYLINEINVFGTLHIAINFYTIGIVLMLGLPGVLLLSAMQLWII